LSIDIDLEATRLLDWLASQPESDRLYYEAATFTQANDLPDSAGRLLVQHLADRGWVNPAIAINGHAEAFMTADGFQHINTIRAMRRVPRDRARALRQQMLGWLYHREDDGQTTSSWDGFLTDKNVHMHGEPFVERELEREARALVDKGLIVSTRSVDQWGPGLSWPALTDAGRDCVMETGGDVAEYFDRQRRGNPPNIPNINVSGNSGPVAIGSHHVTQTVNTGVDVEPILQFAAAARQILPVSQLPAEQQAEIDRQAQDLADEAKSQNPDKGRMRRFVEAIMDGLTKAATPATAAIATAYGNDVVRALGGH
jgi:hypothetical protein